MLYHSFPRRSTEAQVKAFGYSSTNEIEFGLEILESILRFGILLTPERLEIPRNPVSARVDPPGPLSIVQRRACFTLLRRDELLRLNVQGSDQEDGRRLGHTQTFGSFSIGVDPIEGRQLGIMPAFYYYKSKDFFSRRGWMNTDLINFSPSSELLFRLAEIRALMVCIATFEALGAPDDRQVYRLGRMRSKGLKLHNERDVTRALLDLTPELAGVIHKCIDTDRVPAWNMIDWIDIILNMFQIADDKDRIGSLNYYQQREWRLPQYFSPLVECYAVFTDLVRQQPRWICQENLVTLREILMRHSAEQKFKLFRDEIFLLSGTDQRPFRSFIREIVVPHSAADRCEELVVRHLCYQAGGLHNAYSRCGAGDFVVFSVN